MIEVLNLTKKYGGNTAVNNISFTVKSGEIVGFLGANGAGKSTTMNMITGFLEPTDGTARLCGIDIRQDPIAAKRKIGYLPEQPPLYFDMTTEEQLEFVCDAKGIRSKERKAELERVCELVRITHMRRRTIRNLSKGYKQRVGLAQALIGSPEVLILDEPTVGLDPQQIIDIRTVIEELGKQHTVLLSSHILPEIETICQRIVVIHRGNLVADDTPSALSEKMQLHKRIYLRAAGPREGIEEVLKGISGIDGLEYNGSGEAGCYDFFIETDKSRDIRKELFNQLAKKGYPIYLLKPDDMRLEDIFMQITSTAEAFSQSREGTKTAEDKLARGRIEEREDAKQEKAEGQEADNHGGSI